MVLLLASPLSYAQSLTTVLSTNTITIGDPVDWTLALELPSGAVPDIPDPSAQSMITLLDRQGPSLIQTNGMVAAEIRYRLTSFVPGTHRLLREPVRYRDANGNLQTLPAPQDTLRVESVLTNQAEAVRDLKPIRKAPPPPYARILGVIAAVAAIAALVGGLMWMVAHRKRSRAIAIPAASPYDIARHALEHLRAKDYPGRGEAEPFYIELSAIVRTYIEGRFDIHAPELTTEEFIRAAAASPALKLDQRALVERFLVQADLVKFARFSPTRPDMDAAMDAADGFVNETGRPAPAPEGAAP